MVHGDRIEIEIYFTSIFDRMFSFSWDAHPLVLRGCQV